MPKILIIEDDASFGQMLQKFLERKHFEVLLSLTGPDGERQLENSSFDIVLTDLRLPDYDGIKLVSKWGHTVPVVVMTGFAEVATAVKAMKQGAFDYIAKPFPPDQLLRILQNGLEEKGKSTSNVTDSISGKIKKAGEIAVATPRTEFEFVSEASEKLEEYISLVAPTDMSVLIIGESGTGKEVTAKAIHQQSKRAGEAFVPLDCGAIPKELAASEFFGHLKGSFTGAIDDKMGSFEAANGGTLFLDEVGNLSYENQIQLLRALQERKIKRIGSNTEIKVDVRILSATNEDLQLAVAKGEFREDLYHRLNEFSLQLPTLVDRVGDLPLLIQHFLAKSNQKLGKKVAGFSQEVWEVFNTYHWPGNIRELKNCIQRAVLLTDGTEVQLKALTKEMKSPGTKRADMETLSKADFEKEQIVKALKRTNYNKSKAAKLLQVTRKTLYNRISHYGLDI
ncbi:sigma-54-dependent transcriptional regulator [Maribacter sp. 2210JD10-5]|uniref:sigma-54-dependent transcriptional regulator n=1 Tax=Maribacter sp. 2210JD10-5 TaxID=3386272 RepID=UPI0039BCFB44